MSAVHLVVDAAFCLGFILACRPLYRIVVKSLDKKYNKIKNCVQEVLVVERKSKSLLENAIINSSNLKGRVNKILEKANDEYHSIIKKGEKDIEKMVEGYLDFVAKKISSQISEVIHHLRINAAEIARDAVKELVEEVLRDHKVSDKVNASLTDKLNKTLH